ncbi:MAG: acetyl-CoA C-acyltransferase [Rhodospirillales bacterium]|nr:acetyl-CoA C-acyltransferase [Rhodospirillales bacterium]
MTASDPIVIVGAARTPMGGFQGDFTDVKAPALGSAAIKEALSRAAVAPEDVDEVIMGVVLPAGMGQAPARQASSGAGIPWDKGCTTVNKMCGSGMKATMLAHDAIMAGSNDVMVAGGMESMTNAPYLMDNARGGMRMGHGKVYDHMFLDGLEDAYEPGRLMGTYAEDAAQDYQFTREEQDEFAITSLKRAQAAIANGDSAKEIVPVTVKTRRGETVIEIDEQPGNARIDKIPSLKPAFRKDGTVTAANSSSISDGGSALVLMKQSEAEKRGLKPLAKILAHSTHADEPKHFVKAPVGAIQKVLDKVDWSVEDVDLYEVNEAFAVVTMIAMRDLNIPHDKVNIFGGACALGHPVGSSGSRIIVTLINALNKTGGTKGVASLCIGGGEATAVALEVMN